MPYPPYPRLSKAPIAEAVIELKVRTAAPIQAAGLAPLRDALHDRYATIRDIHSVRTSVSLDAERGASQSMRASTLGIRFESQDKRTVVQAKIDAVAISHLAPYDRWEALRDEAREIWSAYAEVVRPEAVTRIGVRYINRIELLEDPVDLDDVLTAGPKVPAQMPQALTEFFTRLVIPFPEKDVTVGVMQTLETPPPPTQDGPPSVAKVVIDIDAFTNRAFKIDDPGIWAALETLREVKNMAFFSSLTEQTLERFK